MFDAGSFGNCDEIRLEKRTYMYAAVHRARADVAFMHLLVFFVDSMLERLFGSL